MWDVNQSQWTVIEPAAASVGAAQFPLSEHASHPWLQSMLYIRRIAARSSSEMAFMALPLSATKMFMIFSTLMKGSQEFLPAETFRLLILAFDSEGTFPHF